METLQRSRLVQDTVEKQIRWKHCKRVNQVETLQRSRLSGNTVKGQIRSKHCRGVDQVEILQRSRLDKNSVEEQIRWKLCRLDQQKLLPMAIEKMSKCLQVQRKQNFQSQYLKNVYSLTQLSETYQQQQKRIKNLITCLYFYTKLIKIAKIVEFFKCLEILKKPFSLLQFPYFVSQNNYIMLLKILYFEDWRLLILLMFREYIKLRLAMNF